MATSWAARLTEDEKQNMSTRLQCYLGRHIHTIPHMPHAETIVPLVVSSRHKDEDLEVWLALRKRWLAAPDEKPPVMHSPQALGYNLVMDRPPAHVFGLQIPDEIMSEYHVPSWFPRDGERNTVFVPEIVPDSLRADFDEWCAFSVQVTDRVGRTWKTLQKVLNIASTVGQLHRMMPDLLKYVYDTSKEALAQQQRRSPLPAEWMEVNRVDVRLAQDHLALCHMLPPQDMEGRGWHRSDESFHHHMQGRLLAFGRYGRRHTNYHTTHSCTEGQFLSYVDRDGELKQPVKNGLDD